MKYNQKSSQVLMGVVASLFVSAAVSASSAANTAAADASRAMAAQEKAMKAPVAPLAAPTAGIKKAPAPTPQPQVEGADAIRFVLNGVNIEGNTAVSTDELKSIYSGKIGKEISLSEVYKIAEAMEVAYRLKGFEFSTVLVPEQKVSGGVVKLVVVEASIGEVRFEGELRGRQDIMDSIKAKLLASKPLRNADLERYVLLLNDMPGVQATATLGRSAMKNMTDVTFTLKAKPVDVAVMGDNSKPEKLGTYQGTAMVSLNNVMGMYEKLTLRGSTDKEFKKSRYVGGSLSAVLFSEGTQATLSGMYSDTAPEKKKLDTSVGAVEGKTKGFTVDLMHPFVRTRAINLRLNAGFDYKDSETKINTAPTEANYRSATFGGTFDVADAAAGVTVFNVEGELGLDVMSATPSSATKNAAGEYGAAVGGNVSVNNFKKVTGTVTRLQSVPGAPGLSFKLSGTGQYSADPLPSSKEFSFGGREYGRGLDSGIMSGDKGFSGKAEVSYAYPVTSLKIEPYLFGEYGQSWNNDNKTLVTGSKTTFKKYDEKEDLLSAFTVGGGLKLDVMEYVSLYAEGAWVLGMSDGLKGKFSPVAKAADGTKPEVKDTATDAEKAQRDGTVRFFFGLTARY